MSRYRNILVAFDGSDSSKNALKQILGLAKKENFRATAVTVLKTTDSEAGVNRAKNAQEASRMPGEPVVTNSVKMVVKENGDEVQMILEEGVVHKAIIDVAEKRSCDLIVMGRRSLTRLERALAGSFSAQVMRHSPLDVLIMQNTTNLGWKSVLLATDGSKFSEAASERAIEIAQEHGGELKVVSVVDTADNILNEVPGNLDRMSKHAEENIESVRQKAKPFDIKVEGFIRSGHPHLEIVKLAKELKIDVLCMGTHGRTGLNRLLMGSVTEQVLEDAPCSVLVVKAS